jgi:hypothetical protein
MRGFSLEKQMPYSQITPIIGQVQQGYFYQIDTVSREILGIVLPGVDNYWGFGEFMYVQFPASAPITQGQLVVISGFGGAAGYSASIAPNSANTGRSVAVVMNAVGNVAAIQYGWVMISGNAVIKAVASVPAGTSFGIDAVTAGSVNAVSAGRQVLNAVSLAPSTTTVIKTATLINGSPRIVMSNVDGIVPGLTVTGAGVSGTVLSIDPDNRTVILTANSTVGGNSSVTFTYTGFVVGQVNRAFLQGAIT